jgi:hypothetical protein
MHIRRMLYLLANFTLLFLVAGAKAADTALPFDSSRLIEVRTLAAFPKEVTAALGWPQPGPGGIVDVYDKFNARNDVGNELPLRRFYEGGLSSDGAVIIYEQGGRPPTYHAVVFTPTRLGWSKLRDWTLDERTFLREWLETVDSVHHPGTKHNYRLSARMALTRPMRRDGPLREVNLSDNEVREIQSVVSELYPGAILNISGVVTGCPCEEGASCSDQVWTVAHSEGRIDGLQLSRIGDRWMVGSIQQWWLSYAQLQASRNLSPVKRTEALQSLWDSFPACLQETDRANRSPQP